MKKLLEGKIQQFNAGAYFEVQDRRILSVHGGTTIFEGMQNHTSESIKSLEGFDRAWFEEAQNASDKSITLLRPTHPQARIAALVWLEPREAIRPSGCTSARPEASARSCRC